MADDADQWLGLLLSPSGRSVGQPDDPELWLNLCKVKNLALYSTLPLVCSA